MLETAVILASNSQIRAEMLRKAGVTITTMPARIDEEEIKAALVLEDLKPRDIADQLADAKSQKVGNRFPAAFVIGADQVLDFDGRLLSKPSSEGELREQLMMLSGKVHRLYSAAVISSGGAPVWRHIERVELQMRELTPEFVDTYVQENFEAVRHSVGGYQIEGLGAQLISAYRGDYFAVLGLPLLQILDYLRVREVLPR